MPFKSHKQQAFLFANKPKVAKEFASNIIDYKDMPEKIGKQSIVKRLAKRKK